MRGDLWPRPLGGPAAQAGLKAARALTLARSPGAGAAGGFDAEKRLRRLPGLGSHKGGVRNVRSPWEECGTVGEPFR